MLCYCLFFYLTTCSDGCYRNNTPDEKKVRYLYVNKDEIGVEIQKSLFFLPCSDQKSEGIIYRANLTCLPNMQRLLYIFLPMKKRILVNFIFSY